MSGKPPQKKRDGKTHRRNDSSEYTEVPQPNPVEGTSRRTLDYPSRGKTYYQKDKK